jgi:tRNA (guanine-N(7)-)-methyltransferase subunit TRM82
MVFPYSQVHVHDSIVFAARSGRIESFNLHDGSHLSTWIHPDTEKFIDSIKPIDQEILEDTPTSEPPAKRQKTSESDEGAASNSRKDEQTPDEAQAGGSGKNGPKQPKPKREDRPVIIQIMGTSDGKHIIAVSGHDKAIWVFENTGAGQLKELSKRSACSSQKQRSPCASS